MKQNTNIKTTPSYNLLGESVKEEKLETEVYSVNGQPFEIERIDSSEPDSFIKDLLKIFMAENNLKYKE